jgi:hypothetical protein
MRHLRRALEASGPVTATPEVLDKLADAVHQAACWLPPWSDPMTLVVTAGFELVAWHRPRLVMRDRRVAFAWSADPRERGVRVLRAFARVLLCHVAQIEHPSSEAVEALAGRLLIPAAMTAAARRDPNQPAANAPLPFVLARIGAVPVSLSGTFARACGK